jgi:hypothetical protein
VEPWAWGVDISTKRIAIACVRATDSYAEAVPCAGPPFDRLPCTRTATVELTLRLAADHPPVYVLVEQPGGRTVEPQLWYSVGVALCGVLEGLSRAEMAPALSTVVPASWKACAGLGGGANKAAIAAFARERYGWEGAQDEADALAIATCAWRRFEAQWPALAA